MSKTNLTIKLNKQNINKKSIKKKSSSSAKDFFDKLILNFSYLITYISNYVFNDSYLSISTLDQKY